MRKTIFSLCGVLLLAGCAGSSYYETELNYEQDGPDCIYYNYENGADIIKGIRSLETTEKVVYRDTKCSDLFKKDTADINKVHNRKALVDTNPKYEFDNFSENDYFTSQPIIIQIHKDTKSEKRAGCSKRGKKQVLKNRYYIVPGQE